jgi:hypothetical protein
MAGICRPRSTIIAAIRRNKFPVYPVFFAGEEKFAQSFGRASRAGFSAAGKRAAERAKNPL